MAILKPHRVRAVISLATTLYTLTLLATSPAIRSTLLTVFSPRAHPYRLAALVSALLLNIKTWPLAWHVRIFGTMVYQLYLQPSALPPRALFRPLLTTNCRTSLFECDYNLHKSNSTYFADLDVARSALVCALLRNGIRTRGTKIPRSGATSGEGVKPALPSAPAAGAAGTANEAANGAAVHPSPSSTSTSTPGSSSPPQSSAPPSATADSLALPPTPTPTLDALEQSKAHFSMALGAVSTHFKREVQPYEPFDIWTRVLTWDRKWLYLVSHVVRAGAVPPAQDGLVCAMQPWRRAGASSSSSRRWWPRRAASATQKAAGRDAADAAAAVPSSDSDSDSPSICRQQQRDAWQRAIFATSIAKYCVKKGRITVPMDEVLVRNALVPPRPGDGAGGASSLASAEDTDTREAAGDGGDARLPAWTWENVEAERRRGMRLAGQFGALDALAGEFPDVPAESAVGAGGAEGVVVLGEFPDLVA